MQALYARKGLTFTSKAVDRRKYRNLQLDLLAENVRKNLNMDMVYRIIEEGV